MGRALDLLIVDDDPGQKRLLEELLAQLHLRHRCHHCANGLQTLDFLNQKPPFEGAPRPDLILLDMNMTGMSGCEVLHLVKSDPELRSIPVIMLSSSLALQDVNACYSEYANAYVSKPADLASALDLLRHLDRFWGNTVLLPR